MKVDDFDFELPEELIAQTPLLDRTTSRLMVLDQSKKRSNIEFLKMYSII